MRSLTLTTESPSFYIRYERLGNLAVLSPPWQCPMPQLAIHIHALLI